MIYIMWFHNKSQPCKIGLLMLSRETGLDFVGILQKDFLSQWDLIFRQYPMCHDTGLQKVSKPLKMHFCHLTLLDWSVKCTQESNGPPQSQSTNKNDCCPLEICGLIHINTKSLSFSLTSSVIHYFRDHHHSYCCRGACCGCGGRSHRVCCSGTFLPLS